MTGPRDDTAEGLLDGLDAVILADLHGFHALADPPPVDLAERVRFTIALDNLDPDTVVSRIQDDLLVGSGARGAERTRTVTFDCDSLTIMVAVADAADSGLRLDGWLAPPGALRVELRTTTGSRAVTADEGGRFVLDGVPKGLAQLIVHPTDGSAVQLASKVVTPSLML
jgi:hypothetical protein